MTPRTRNTSNSLRTRLLVLFLSYALFISFSTPFALNKVEAVSREDERPMAPRLGAINNSLTGNSLNQRQGKQRDGELLVRFRAGVSEQEKAALVTLRGAHRKQQIRGESGIEKLEVPSGQAPEAVAAELLSNPQVEFVEPNFLIQHNELTPGDPRFSEQWALKNMGQSGGKAGADVSATTAWDVTTGSYLTVIAVIDSGIDFTHPDLAQAEWTNQAVGSGSDLHGWDYVTNTGEIKDEQGHGTAIAGIIAAEGNNSVGITGMMWRASLMSLRVLDSTGTGDVAKAVEAIDYAVAHGAQVINISWGTEGASLALKDAIERAGRRGVVVVCSAGNDGRDIDNAPYYPASFDLPNLIAVGSTDNSDQLASWSNRGATRVTVAAPGINILTTQMGGGYGAVTGTSASAPLVTGVLGLVKTAYPSLNTKSAVAAVVKGVRQVSGLSGKVSAGGVLSAAGALGVVRSRGGDPTPAPSPGEGNDNGSGNNGNGGGNGGQPFPVHTPPDGKGGGSRVTPPSNASGSPGQNLPDLDQLRNHKAKQTKYPTPIHSNLLCADCGGSVSGNGNYPTDDPYFSNARLRPINRTGVESSSSSSNNSNSTPASSVTLGSRNYGWSLPLVGLKGRAGMDLNLSLSYNSLVWTKDSPYIKFNADHGVPGPGFRLGFPLLQQSFRDSRTNQQSYMMVTPSGGRVEFRPSPTANVYESADSTYAQLDMSTPSVPVVRYTDGTQMFFGNSVSGLNEYRCTRIEDHNGNLIDATYDANGHIQSITDTLGRVITFNYPSGNLDSITQQWNGTAHQWARFEYSSLTLQPNFTGLYVNMPTGGSVTVLTKVILADNSYYTFDYNNYGQVTLISHKAADNHLRAYTSYSLDNTTTPSDCPRVTERHDWAEYWSGSYGNPNEFVTTYSVDPSGANAWSQQTTPDHVVYKEYFATSGWQTGLPTRTEYFMDSAPTALLKWTTTSWTQDDETLSYQKNPRPTETNIYDSNNNRRRATFIYQAFTLPSGALCNLPSDVTEYAADGTTALRKTHTDYKLDSVYLSRRRIGLVAGKYVYDGSNVLQAKTIYDYDWPNWPEHLQATPTTATQHDEYSFGPNTAAGRGNLVLEQHWGWDASTPYNFTKTEEYKWGYYTTGTVAFASDPLNHQTNSSYNDSNGGNTYAYPTATTDPDQRWSSNPQQTLMHYNYDMGVVTWIQTPAPLGSAQGPIRTMDYDNAGRLIKVAHKLNGNDYSYTSLTYPDSQDVVHTYTTVSDLVNTEHSWQLFDGMGRVRATASDHPTSSGLHYKAQYIAYDIMGRVSRQSNPTEIDGNWVPTGDDYTWFFNVQQYDWKGRPTTLTHPDGWQQVNTYGGCGCAGGEVVTMQDEAGRQRRLTTDVLGRLSKVEEFKLVGGSQTIYSTTNYSYDALDHLINVTQQGSRVRSFEYDGFGRIWHETTPEQGLTTYSYNADDTLYASTDARGATTTYSYNGRHMVTGLTYGLPTGVTPAVALTNNVTYDYDAAGNRTAMTERNPQSNAVTGSTSYQYDLFSRLSSETRYFADLNRSYTLTYAYNLANQLMSVQNPFGVTFSYDRDGAGRITAVHGSSTPAGYANAANYVTNVQYRAFDVPKSMSYGNGRSLSQLYDNRMRMTRWYIPSVLGSDYAYQYFNENTNRVTLALSNVDSRLDHSYSYDQVGRLIESRTSTDARQATGTGSFNGQYDGPYAQVYNYDEWGNMTSRSGWGAENPSYTAQFDSHNRMLVNPANGAAMGYDAAGNIYNDGSQTYTYDATGQQATASGHGLQMFYDGDGLRVRKVEDNASTYYLRSTVLGGQVLADLNSAGDWLHGYVYMGNQLLAYQESGRVLWVHEDPVTKAKRTTDTGGAIVNSVEFDPFGGQVSSSTWNINSWLQPHRYTSYERDANWSDDAMARRYNRWWSRFDQPDPSNNSYSLQNPQSLNRYSYVQNDPVNFTDPTGLNLAFLDCHMVLDAGTDGGSFHMPIFYEHWVCTIEIYDTGRFYPPDILGGGSVPDDQKGKDAYEDCKSKVTGGAPMPSREAARAILQVSRMEGVSPALLAVTWASESTFDFNPSNNPNDGTDRNVDIGPVQINLKTWYGSTLFNGLDEPFGSNQVGNETFSGNPMSNLRAGARILNSYGNGRTAAGHYRTGTGDYSKSKKGTSDFNARAGAYDKWAAGYQAFFNCLASAPFGFY